MTNPAAGKFTLKASAQVRNVRRVVTLHRDFLDRGAELEGEREVLRRDGSMPNVIARSVRVPGDDGRWRRLVYVVDITERRRVEVPRRCEWNLSDSVPVAGGARWGLWAAHGLWLGVWATRPGLSPGHPQVSA